MIVSPHDHFPMHRKGGCTYIWIRSEAVTTFPLSDFSIKIVLRLFWTVFLRMYSGSDRCSAKPKYGRGFYSFIFTDLTDCRLFIFVVRYILVVVSFAWYGRYMNVVHVR